MKMLFSSIFYVFIFLNNLSAQKITYATQCDLSTNKIGFTILGKLNNRYLIHIGRFNNMLPQYNTANPYNDNPFTLRSSDIYVFDNEMRLVSSEQLKLGTQYEGLHFISYANFIYMFYQYTESNHSFCMAVKIDSNGKMIDAPIKIAETTRKDYYSNSAIYNILFSEDKSKIAVFTFGDFESIHRLTLMLFDQSLKNIKKETVEIPRTNFHESFSNFNIDNSGNFIFLRKNEYDNSDPFKYLLAINEYNSKDLSYYNLTPGSIQINTPLIQIDNINKKLYFFCFYADSSINVFGRPVHVSKTAAKSGLFKITWNMADKRLQDASMLPFYNMARSYKDDLDFQSLPIQNFRASNLYAQKNGDYIIEGDNFDYSKIIRDLPLNPNLLPTAPNYNLFYLGYFFWERQAQSDREYLNYNNNNGDGFFSAKTIGKYSAYKILVSFDTTGEVKKFEFLNDLNIIGDMTFNTENAIHYLFNHRVKKDNFIEHLELRDDGGIEKKLPIQDPGNYRFMFPGSQVSATELILPVLYNNKLNFVKIEF